MEQTFIDTILAQKNIVLFMDELHTVQQRLKVPKDRRNSFGNYKYRSAADILEQVKPILEELHCTLITPSISISYPDRLKVRVYAILANDKGEVAYATSEAVEETARRGMDGSQISGAAESYAKKYALGNLFAIDDTQDADATNTHQRDNDDTTPSADTIAIIRSCSTINELLSLYNANPSWRSNNTILAAFTQRKNELKDE